MVAHTQIDHDLKLSPCVQCLCTLSPERQNCTLDGAGCFGATHLDPSRMPRKRETVAVWTDIQERLRDLNWDPVVRLMTLLRKTLF